MAQKNMMFPICQLYCMGRNIPRSCSIPALIIPGTYDRGVKPYGNSERHMNHLTVTGNTWIWTPTWRFADQNTINYSSSEYVFKMGYRTRQRLTKIIHNIIVSVCKSLLAGNGEAMVMDVSGKKRYKLWNTNNFRWSLKFQRYDIFVCVFVML